MPGEANLERLLSTLSPTLVPGAYVFLTFPVSSYGDHANLVPIASFLEPEGLTLVVPQDRAVAQNLDTGPAFACITLQAHSSLEAVGLTAVVARALTVRGISANVLAGYFHDHVFVPLNRSSEALEALGELSSRES